MTSYEQFREEASNLSDDGLRKTLRKLEDGLADFETKFMGKKLSIDELNFRDDMRRAVSAHRAAWNERFPSRPLTVKDFGGDGTRASDYTFRSVGEQFAAIARAFSPGGEIDPRLHQVRVATGLGESVGADGGYLLQPNFSNDIYQAAFEVGKLARLCRRIPITQGNSLKIPGLDETSRVAGSRHGGVQSYWLAEASEKSASRPKFRTINLELKKSVVLIYSTDELLSDVNALDAYIRKVAADELAFTLDEAIMRGSGAGQPLGFLNATSLVTQAAESGQSSGVVLENIVKMWGRLIPSSRPNAVWLVGTGVESALYQMSLSVGTGGAPAANGSGVIDIDGDGRLDLLLHFWTRESGIACGDTSASLTGSTYTGQTFRGSDSIVTVGCR